MLIDRLDTGNSGGEKPSYQAHNLESELYASYRPGQKLDLSQLSPDELLERSIFWANVEKLLQKLEAMAGGSPTTRALTGSGLYVELTKVITQFVEELKPEDNNALPLKKHLLKKHLTEVANYLADLAQLFTSQTSYAGDQRGALQAKHLELLTSIVAPLHDVIKQLSSRGQISTDHQVVIQYILATYGKSFGLNEDEANFCAAVAGDHENANSLPRAELLTTAAEEGLDKESQVIAEGKIIFYLADTFTGLLKVVERSGIKQLELDVGALAQRFQDILDRWNDPLISRQIEPEWAILAYLDYQAALKLLEKNYGITMPKDALLAVLETAIRSFEGLITSFKVREKDREKLKLIDNESRALPVAPVENFEQVIEQLKELAAAERASQKEVTLNLLVTRLENLSRSLASGPLSDGGRIARAVQKSYEIVEENKIVPDDEAVEINADDYLQSVAEKFQAFNLVSVATATNLIYYYLQSPLHQEAILQFFEQNQYGELSVEKIQESPSLLLLAEELAAQLHNQYTLSLGDGRMWSQLGAEVEGREKKEKSYIVAMQLLRNVFDYSKDTNLTGKLILSLSERNKLRENNFTHTESDVKNHLEETDADRIARISHQWWRAAKLIEDSAVDVPEFDELDEEKRKKSKVAAAVALENIIRDLSKVSALTAPLPRLSELIIYLFAMIKTPNNLEHQRNSDQTLVNWAEKLTNMGYKTWLMNELSREGGLNRLTELGEANYFSILTKTKEDLDYVQLGDLHLSYKDLDRLPILCAAIALYFDYYKKIFTKHQKFLSSLEPSFEKEWRVVQAINEEIGAVTGAAIAIP